MLEIPAYLQDDLPREWTNALLGEGGYDSYRYASKPIVNLP
jgi:hypothetical protein